jgi:DnaJ-class molecular chaperone
VTPWAELLLRPSSTDDEVRARFHGLARAQHPDRPGAEGLEGPRWAAVTKAYGQVKTVALRAAWERQQALLSGCCPTCRGTGIVGGRLGKAIKICPVCHGEGRRVI